MRTAAAALVLAGAFCLTAAAGAVPGPPDAPEYWFATWHVPALWHDGARGQGITIAEIDTGVNAALPELRGRVLAGRDYGDAGNGQIDHQIDTFGHGTAMASIMVARPGVLNITGIAPDAKILPISVPLGGTTTQGRPDQVPAAIRYGVDHGAKIINMSLGGVRKPSVDPEACPADEQAAIYYALRKGALLIASVGNTGPSQNTIEDPAVCLGVIAVGAVDAGGVVADFSARVPYVTLVGPGVNVPSLGRIPGEAFAGEGSSQAAALTSAAAALVWSAHPGLDARGVATRIIATLDHRRENPSPAYGYGVLNAYRAVTADVPADAPNPVFDAVQPFLARQQARGLGRPAAPPPAAADHPTPLGPVLVGSRTWLTPQIALGIALAAAGLLLSSGSGLVLARGGARPVARRPEPGPRRRRPQPTPPRRPVPGPPRRPSPGPPRRPRPSFEPLG
jgi:subtilisin family serine protease